jgi:peptide/nickel transport system permease protein
MVTYTLKRLGHITITLAVISMISFMIIQLPAGDFLTTYAQQLRSQGSEIDQAELEALKEQFGLDRSIVVQYWKWISGIVTRGDFGISFQQQRPVRNLIGERFGLTMVLAVATMFFVYLIGIPIGIFSALHQYSLADYLLTLLGFLGLAIPNFLFALILMYIGIKYFGTSVGGLFSPQYEFAPWSAGKLLDLLSHLWIPIVVVGTADTTAYVRVMRATMLDELSQPYVETARAKGVPEGRLILKYPVRIALSPILSTVGFTLPAIVSGTAITAVVLNIPTLGPLLLQSLLSQDMYLAGSIILVLGVMTVVGSFFSDLLLAWADPRIRL